MRRFVREGAIGPHLEQPLPPRPRDSAGIPASGSETLPSFATIRMRPGRSPTMIRPSGRKSKQKRAGQSLRRRSRRRRPRCFAGCGARVWPEPLRNRRVAVGRGAAILGPRRPGAGAGGRGIALGGRLARKRQRRRRPSGRRRRHPLVHAVRKPALEVRLNRHRPRLDDPRSIVDLRAQQILEALSVGADRPAATTPLSRSATSASPVA